LVCYSECEQLQTNANGLSQITEKVTLSINKKVMSKYCYFLLFTFYIFSSCHSTQGLEKATDNVIIFGSGGGFTGQVNEYMLDAKGSLKIKERNKSEMTSLPSLKPSLVKKLFKQLRVIQFDTISFKHPGNMYCFIKTSKSGVLHEVIWGDPRYPVSAEIKQFYELLISTTK
jgi:hypothetical protein